MQATSESAIWIKAPMADVAVVIVISASLPHPFIDQLHGAINGWDQVACLVVEYPTALLSDWLRSGSNPTESASTSSSQAQLLLNSVPPNCYLLDVEADPVPGLAWLGSVLGHKLRVVELNGIAHTDAAMDEAVEQVLSAVRTLAKILLQERCVL